MKEEGLFAGKNGWIFTGIILILVVIAFTVVVYFFITYKDDNAPYTFTKNLPMTNSTTPGTNIYDAKCNDGAFVTSFNSNVDKGINQLSAACSNKEILGPFGSSLAGVPGNDVRSESGFTKVNVWYDNRVNGMNVFNGNEFHTIGTLIGNENVQDCGADGRIVGLIGNGDGLVSNLGMICGYKYKQQ
uniref:Uncharacterized protein n=1 Tax=viral metagenome TaxID=1070528 RepID=A0A6C0C844_9ZZZZ